MSLNEAHAFAFSLATTLMVVIVIFRAGDGHVVGFCPPTNTTAIHVADHVSEIDPFSP